MENLDQYLILLQNLTVPDNQIRQNAEQSYNSFLQNQPDFAVFGLLKASGTPDFPVHIRQLSAVLLRRCLVDAEESVYFRLSPQSKPNLLAELINLLVSESDNAIRLKICDIAGELGGGILEPKDWPALFPTVVQLCKSASHGDRLVGLSLIGLISEAQLLHDDNFLIVFGEIMIQNLQELNFDSKGLPLCLKAMNYCIQSIRDSSHLDSLKTLNVPLFTAFGKLIQFNYENRGTMENELSQITEHLIDIGDHSPQYFSDHLNVFLPSILECVRPANSHISSSLKFLLIEFLTTIAVGLTKKIRKYKGPNNDEKEYFAVKFIPICVQMMATVTEDTTWENSDSVEEIHLDSSHPSDVGESALRRVIVSLGVRNTYSVVSSILTTFLLDTNWQRQYAGLLCIACYVEVSVNLPSESQLSVHRKEILGTLMHFVSNPNPRIRYVTFYSLSEFLIHHGSSLDSDQINLVMNLIVSNISIQINPSPRIRRNAVIALMQLINITSLNFLNQHSAQLLSIICATLQEGPTIVQESCVSAIITIAEMNKTNESWGAYYPKIIPILKELLNYAYRRGLESLWAQTLECITVVGEAVGKTYFYQDALEIMELLTTIQKNLESPSNSSLESALIKAWVRIARCLGSEFLPYLKVTVDKLFSAMSQDITVSSTNGNDEDIIIDDDDNDLDDEDGDDDVQMIETENGWVTVRTTIVEEQSAAIQMIQLLAEKLQEHFYPYVEQTIRLLSKLLSSYHEDIRSFSLATLPELVRATGKALPSNRAPLIELSNYSLGLLIDCIAKESSMDLIMTGLIAIRQIILYACTDWSLLKSNEEKSFIRILDESQMISIGQCLKNVFRESLQRRAVLKAESQLQEQTDYIDEDDVDEAEHFFQESLELHYNISEVLNALFLTHTSACWTVYQQEWHDLIVTLSHVYCLKEDRRFAFLITCDIIQFVLPRSSNHLQPPMTPSSSSAGVPSNANYPYQEIFDYLNFFVPLMSESCGTMDNFDFELKRSAAYAIGVAFEHHCDIIKEHIPLCLHHLRSLITQPLDTTENEEEYGQCIDNAVSAVGVIAEQILIYELDYHGEYILNQWLQMLPLKNDLEEGEKDLKQLLRILQDHLRYFLDRPSIMANIMFLFVKVLDDANARYIPPALIQAFRLRLQILWTSDPTHPDFACLLTSTHKESILSHFDEAQKNHFHHLLIYNNHILSSNANIQSNGLSSVSSPSSSTSMPTEPISTSPLATAPIYDVLMHRPPFSS